MQWLRENAGHIAAYLPFILVGVGALLLAARWLIRPRGRMFETHPKLKNVVRTALSWTIPLPFIALVIALWPMSPLFLSARRLAVRTGKPIPDIVFRDVRENREHHLKELRGQVVVLNIWATWCPPCRHELPTLSRLQRQYASRGVTVLTLSDERPDRLAQFLGERAPNTLNGYVPSFDWLPVKAFRPFTLIIGRDGTLRDYFFGAQEFTVFETRLQRNL